MTLLCLASLITAYSGPAAEAVAADASEAQILVAQAERATFGLPSDSATVASLLVSGLDTGSARWGIPMTDRESAALDLPGRMAFAAAVHDKLVPFVESLQTLGGIYFDQRSDGRLVVQLTSRDPAVEEQIRALDPTPTKGVLITYVQTTRQSLEDAAQRAWDAWDRAAIAYKLATVAVDVPRNQLRLEAIGAPSASLTDIASALRPTLGVQLAVVTADPSDVAATCTRTDCVDPMKAGVVVWHSTRPGYVGLCTMGFHIIKGGDKQFLTAGHCGYTGSNDWYHDGYLPTKVGSELASLYSSWGKDAMRVQLPDGQASDDVFGASTNIVGSRNPITGEAVCASLGISALVDCGTVSDDHVTWTDQICGCTVQGADASGLSVVQGDSGSPVFSGSIGGSVVAIGIVNTTGGKFARLQDVLSDFGASINN